MVFSGKVKINFLKGWGLCHLSNCIVCKSPCFYNLLCEIAIFAIFCVHYKAIKRKKIRVIPVINYSGVSYFNKLQKTLLDRILNDMNLID